MDWSNEFYVRLYTRDTTSWRRLGWDGQCVLMQMLRKVDRAGTIELDGIEPWEALVLHCSAPEDQAKRGMEALLRVGVMEVRGDLLVFPNFIEAQEAIKSDKLRAKASRMKKAAGLSQSVTPVSRDATPESHELDTRHDASRDVTPCHSSLRFASLRSAVLPADSKVQSAGGGGHDGLTVPVASDRSADNTQTDRLTASPIPAVATTGLAHSLFEEYRTAAFARDLTPESAGDQQKLRIAQRICDHASRKGLTLRAATDAMIRQAFDDAESGNGKYVLALESAEPGKPKPGRLKSGSPPPAKGIDVLAVRRAMGSTYEPGERE